MHSTTSRTRPEYESSSSVSCVTFVVVANHGLPSVSSPLPSTRFSFYFIPQPPHTPTIPTQRIIPYKAPPSSPVGEQTEPSDRNRTPYDVLSPAPTTTTIVLLLCVHVFVRVRVSVRAPYVRICVCVSATQHPLLVFRFDRFPCIVFHYNMRISQPLSPKHENVNQGRGEKSSPGRNGVDAGDT